MIILILTCFIVAVGGGPNHHASGFGYWNSPGAFAEYLLTGPKGRLLGWWACMRQACFAFTGTEVVGMTFGEMPDPRKNVPRAVKQTFWRIFSFYILGILVLGMALPYDSSDLLSATNSSTNAGKEAFSIQKKLVLFLISSRRKSLRRCYPKCRYQGFARFYQRVSFGFHIERSKFRCVHIGSSKPI